ncbi:MAG: TFIIB-type zinc ribbon-containing protein [Nitrososphaerales archaeon]
MARSIVHDYVRWYRLAEEVFGKIIPHLTEEQIHELTPKRSDWFPIPLASEIDTIDVANRPGPHIDFKSLDDDMIRIGMRFNTVGSVDKMMNILDSLHNEDRTVLISEMKKLDDDYQTQVLAKIKETNYAQVDSYRTEMIVQSNRIDQKIIDQIFQKVKSVREEGRQRMNDEGLSLNPVTPVLDMAFVIVNQDPEIFKEKLGKMKRMYEISLSIKTTPELNKERKKLRAAKPVMIIKFKCSRCGKEYSKDQATNIRFCESDGMRIIPVRGS